MATYDTDTTITVGLEPENVIADAKRISKEIDEILKKADGVDVSKKTESYLDTLKQAKVEIQGLLEKARELANTKVQSPNLEIQTGVMNNTVTQMDQIMQRITDLDEQMDAIAKKQVLTKEYKEATNELKYLEDTYTKLQTSIQKLRDKTKSGKPRSNAFKKLVADAEETRVKILEVKATLQELEDTGKKFESGKSSPEFTERQQQVANLEKTYDALYKSYVRAQENIAKMEEQGTAVVSGLKTPKGLEILGTLDAITKKSILASAEITNLGELEPPPTLREQIQALALSIKDAAASDALPALQSGLSRLGSTIAGVAGKLLKFTFGSPLSIIGSDLSKLGRSAIKVGSVFLDTFGSPLRLAHRSLSIIANSAKKAATNLAKMASHTIINGLKNLGKAISGVSKHSSRNNNVLNKGFKTFIKYAFGVRSFFFLFRKIRTAVINGFGDLAQVHEPFNRAMSSIMTSLNYLRNSFASAFAPIIETVAPALTTFINLVADAVSKIGMLIAALTGKEFVRALPVQKDYAESVSNTAKNAKSASKATSEQNKKAKELQRTLAGFDDVEILHEDKDTDTSSPDPDASAVAAPGFGSGAIDSAVKSFAGKLIEAWNGADFTEIGRIVGEKLKAALESIPWPKIKAVLRKIATVIATFLNGFLEVPGLFYTIGKTLAEGINSAFEFLNAFITKFHWNSLGNAIRDGILGIAQNLDWSVISATFRNLGSGIADFINAGFTDPEVWTGIFTTVGHAINVVLYGIQQLIHNTEWEDLVSSIGTGLSNGFNTINWPAIGDMFISAVNGLINLTYKFVTEFDFKKFGNSVGTGISNAINNIDWAKGAVNVAKTISGLFEALNGFIERIDWKELGSKVVTTIASFLGNFNWSAFGEFISNCFIGLWSFFAGVIETINWDEIPGKILTVISEFLTGFDWAGTVHALGEILAAEFKTLVDAGSSLLTAVFEVAADIIEGGKDGIIDALTNIGTWIVNNIVNPFIDGVKDAFGIASPAKEMMPLGENIIKGMLEGILNPMSTIGNWIKDNIFKPVTDNVTSLFGIGSNNSSFSNIGNNLITDLQNGISGVTSGMNSWVTNNITNKINGFVTSNWGIRNSSSATFNKFGNSLIGGLQSGLTASARASQAWLRSSVTSTMSDYFKNLLGIGSNNGVFNQFGSSLMNDLKTGINGGIQTITGTLSSLQTNMYNAFSGYSWESIGNNITTGIYNGLVRNWSWLTNTAYNLATNIFNSACWALGIASPSKKFAWVGDMITAGMSNGIASTGDRVLDSMSNITNGLIEDAENTTPALVLDDSLSNLDSSIDSILSSFSDKVTTEFTMLIATLEKLGESLQLAIPGIALGQVAPYSIGSTSNSNANTISKLLEVIQDLTANQVTRDDLQEIIEAIDNKELDVRLGDEQVARSANRGNKKLNRRYTPVVL